MNNSNEFYYIVNDIINNQEFNKMKDIKHHGLNRYDHSFKVSYYSYLVTKYLRLNYKDTTRAAMLHDFFLEENFKSNIKKRIKVLINHPKYAVRNSEKYFNLNDMQKDIILSHMFPITLTPPKYLESWIVDIVDDTVSMYERFYQFRKQISFAYSFILVLMLNYVK